MKKWLLRAFALFLLLGTGLMLFGVVLPVYFGGGSQALSGQLSMEQQADGGWVLSWPAGEKADTYRIELFSLTQGQEPELLYREFTEGETSLSLPRLPEDQELAIQVTPGVKIRSLLGEDYRYSEESLTAQASFGTLPVPAGDYDINGDEKTLTITMPENTPWVYRLKDASGKLLAEEYLSDSTAVIGFGDNGIALPQPGKDYSLETRLFQQEDNLLIHGPSAGAFSVTEEALQLRKLNPNLEILSKNTVRLTWEETRGDRYVVQALDSGNWNNLVILSQEEERSFLDLLEPGETKQYRVVALDAAGGELLASEPLTATGRNRVQYATVWPMKELTVFDAAVGGQALGTVPAGKAYCVLEEANGRFAIRFDDKTGYISSDYCMINLPEYLGGLCSYEIANSVSAIYAIHEFAIRDVTGVVTTGYEDVCQQDGSYLVPLLYPAAKRLLEAAQDALELGYRLKIYDSYRPKAATLEIYDLTSLIMADPVPETTYTGLSKDTMDLPNPRPGWDYLSLGWLMTGSYYEQNSFLARGGSAHNQGIALDLTLETWDTREEVKMQSSMHDLSQYSVLGKNNDAADLLGELMHNAGFGGLISEWWHFQDNHARAALNLPYMMAGVNGSCWVRDDFGWKYRDAKGNFCIGQTLEISGTQYTFDSNGYATE